MSPLSSFASENEVSLSSGVSISSFTIICIKLVEKAPILKPLPIPIPYLVLNKRNKSLKSLYNHSQSQYSVSASNQTEVLVHSVRKTGIRTPLAVTVL